MRLLGTCTWLKRTLNRCIDSRVQIGRVTCTIKNLRQKQDELEAQINKRVFVKKYVSYINGKIKKAVVEGEFTVSVSIFEQKENLAYLTSLIAAHFKRRGYSVKVTYFSCNTTHIILNWKQQ